MTLLTYGYTVSVGEYKGLPQRCVGPLHGRGLRTREEVAAYIASDPAGWHGIRGIGPKMKRIIEAWATTDPQDVPPCEHVPVRSGDDRHHCGRCGVRLRLVWVAVDESDL